MAARFRRWLPACVAPLAWLPVAAAFAAGPAAEPVADPDTDGLIVVAIADRPQAMPGVGGTPRADYRSTPGYAGSPRAAADAAELARDFGLVEQKAWTIAPLRWRCMLLRVAPGADRAAVLAALALDPRVELAQPLNSFETLQDAPRPGTPAEVRPDTRADARYNDPYVGLQRGFAAIGAAEAQRHARGEGVRVAVIDTGLDAAHPDLEGRVDAQRDFAAAAHPLNGAAEGHATAVAGVIAAGANNRIGIVGIAPQARLLSYRACWAVAAPAGAARCDSFTLAQALGAAIAADADIINLSLGGPPDPLLAKLAEHAMRRGAIVVGALPPGGRRDGFPVGVPGVLAVASYDDVPNGAPAPQLSAPGREILTLSPGGHYDYSSGSSLAAAHVSGVLALLRSLSPGLRGDMALRWLTLAGPRVDACAAVRQLRAAAVCAAQP